jgi:hypothetical protein
LSYFINCSPYTKIISNKVDEIYIGFHSCSLTLEGEGVCRLVVFEVRMLRGMLGPRKEEVAGG